MIATGTQVGGNASEVGHWPFTVAVPSTFNASGTCLFELRLQPQVQTRHDSRDTRLSGATSCLEYSRRIHAYIGPDGIDKADDEPTFRLRKMSPEACSTGSRAEDSGKATILSICTHWPRTSTRPSQSTFPRGQERPTAQQQCLQWLQGDF